MFLVLNVELVLNGVFSGIVLKLVVFILNIFGLLF